MTNYEKLGLTEEDYKRFKRAAWATYNCIGGDLGELDGGRSQSIQIEVILDADYMYNYGEAHLRTNGEYKEWFSNKIQPLKSKRSSVFMKMMKEIFPHKSYE